MAFRIRNLKTREIEPGFPSPFLIEQGGGEAYTETPGSDNPYWYAKVPGRYESKDGTYVRVLVEKTDDWRVDVTIQPISEQHGQEEPYNDYFIVNAATRTEAEDLATDKAREDVESRFGEEFGSDIRILRAREGVSI